MRSLLLARSESACGAVFMRRRPALFLWTTAVLTASVPISHSFPLHRVNQFRCGADHVQCSKSRTPDEIQMTKDTLLILSKAIEAVDPYNAVWNHLLVGDEGTISCGPSKYELKDYDEIIIVAFGKASSAMTASCIDRLRSSGLSMKGIVIVKDGHATAIEREKLEKVGFVLHEASHPVPDERSTQGANAVIELLSGTTERTLIICCISGGGSALFCHPKPPLTLKDLQLTNQVLLSSGMSIQEMNIIRKRLETGKGGRLAAAAYPGTLLTLVLSDIVGDPLDLIASGPTVPDQSTFAEANRLAKSRGIWDSLPKVVTTLLQKGSLGLVEDNPKQSHPCFSKSQTVLVGNNQLAVNAAAKAAAHLGYNPVVLGTLIDGEAKDVAGVYTGIAEHVATGDEFAIIRKPAALIVGGETTVTLPPNCGKGGRNQEVALVAAIRLNSLGLRNVVLASIGTDGTDGPTDAAGAVVDGGTIDRLGGSAADSLKIHDAYNYFKQNEADGHTPLIKTGPTGTNVADVCVTLIR